MRAALIAGNAVVGMLVMCWTGVALARSPVRLPPPSSERTDLPATGQTFCWDSNGNRIACSGTAQDGDVRAGAPLSYTSNADGTITDNNTKLVWEKQTTCCDTNSQGPHCAYTIYSFQGALDYVAALNAADFAGHNDWRVANVKELQSIVDYNRLAFPYSDPAVPSAFNDGSCDSGSWAGYYWSSTTYAISGGQGVNGWAVYFADGSVTGYGKAAQLAARAVRGGLGVASTDFPATGQTICWGNGDNGNIISCTGTGEDGDLRSGAPLSYTSNDDGTVTDNNTKLVWEKKGNCSNATHCVDDVYTWQGALDYVAALNAANFAGHNDWRLPNIKELLSIVNYNRGELFDGEPAVASAFTDCTNGSCNTMNSCWSSTTDAISPGGAWGVLFLDGSVTNNAKSAQNCVRAVRGGS